MSKKLIVIKPTGNHSNRLIQNLNFEVFCKEFDIEYNNPTFNNMSQYYVAPCLSESSSFLNFLQIDILGSLFRHSKVIKRMFSVVWIMSKLGFLKFIRFDKDFGEPNCINTLLNAFEKNNVVYVAGWYFRAPELMEKHKDEFQKRYNLKQSLYVNSSLVPIINELKQQNYTIIGVHIRRGDYKSWKNGIYYYNDDVYEKYMRSLSEQLTNAGTTKQIFVLFSNETPNIQESENVILSKENWCIDQYIMSKCDYLIGPPSTFTLWASYLGQTKLFHIYNCNAPLVLELL